ncbi:MAG: LytR/AlgR family response regulator transcription factor, partial [Saprospiraceae bacterium]
MKCVIIEDEKPAQRLLKSYIKKSTQLELVGVFDSVMDADLKLIESAQILFLDINLPEISGLAFLRMIQHRPEVIITTAFPDYALDAFELEITDYLLKPFSFERFFKALQKAEQFIQLKNNHTSINSENERSFIFIYANKAFHRIDKGSILFIKSDGDYIHIITNREKWMLKDSLKNWQTKLSPTKFTKVHQSYIVNISKIDKLEGNRIRIGQHEIPVSRANRTQLIEQ